MGNPKGTPETRARDQARAAAEAQAEVAKANAPVPLPDYTDAAVRQRQAEALKKLVGRRGRSYTLMSGRTGDASPTPLKRAILKRAG
jgi:hypothetical protein